MYLALWLMLLDHRAKGPRELLMVRQTSISTVNPTWNSDVKYFKIINRKFMTFCFQTISNVVPLGFCLIALLSSHCG